MQNFKTFFWAIFGEGERGEDSVDNKGFLSHLP
jgi:hypothetical protein